MTGKQEPSVSVEDADLPQSERRRPGRVATVSRALIRLLRGVTVPATDHAERQQNDLAPATGIAVSALISGLIWAILIWIV
jgi:hypothetical protein